MEIGRFSGMLEMVADGVGDDEREKLIGCWTSVFGSLRFPFAGLCGCLVGEGG